MRALSALVLAASVLLVAPGAQASAPVTAPTGLFDNVAQIDRTQIIVAPADAGYMAGVSAWTTFVR